jgi:hypothetical protein
MKLKPLALATLVLIATGLCGCSRKVVEPTAPPGTPPGGQRSTNIPPDTWFAGPDPNDAAAGWLTDPGPFGGRYLPAPVDGWYVFPGIPHTMLSAESLQVFPKDRPERRTFFEVYGDRIWLRQEGDTVHMSSWAILPSGGSDPDSPYSVLVNVALLQLWDPAPVLMPGDPNGSPIGFHLRVELQDVLGRVSQPSESLIYPRYDPTSALHNPVINGYYPLIEAGRAYAVARAVDGDGAVDRRVDRQLGGAVGIVARVDGGGGTPDDVALRSKILTFYVDHPPQLLQGNPTFRPVANQVFTTRTLYAGRDLDLIAADDDPFDATAYPQNHSRIYSHVGGPKGPPILRRRIAILGKWTGDPSRDTCYVVPGDLMSPMATFTIPDWIANGPITLLVRLCDCFACDVRPGPGACPSFAGSELRASFGRCVDTEIPCRLAVPEPVAGASGGVR